MNVRRGNPPSQVERSLSIDLTREEVIYILTSYIKAKVAQGAKLTDIKVSGDEAGKMQTLTISGVEVVPLQWKENVPEPV